MSSLTTVDVTGKPDTNSPDYHTFNQYESSMLLGPPSSADSCASKLKAAHGWNQPLPVYRAGSCRSVRFEMTGQSMVPKAEMSFELTPYSSWEKEVSIDAIVLRLIRNVTADCNMTDCPWIRANSQESATQTSGIRVARGPR